MHQGRRECSKSRRLFITSYARLPEMRGQTEQKRRIRSILLMQEISHPIATDECVFYEKLAGLDLFDDH